jgi:dTDP-4-dehydrorhamnose reductase
MPGAGSFAMIVTRRRRRRSVSSSWGRQLIVRVIVTGATGFVGQHVVRHALEAGMSVLATHHRQAPGTADADWVHVDIANPTQVDDLIRRSGADAVVHTAAALSDSLSPLAASLNWQVNVVAAVDVARSSSRHGARLVHISSDAIFGGRADPYTESDLPDPIYPYGAAKAAAEVGVAAVCPEAVLVRTSLIHGDGDVQSKRERFIADVCAGRTDGAFFTDEVKCPIGVNDLAQACVELVRTDYAGVLNVAGPDAVTWHELATLIAVRQGLDPDDAPAATRAERGVHRPGRVVLDSSRARALLRTKVRGIREILAPQPSTVAGVNR